MKSIDQSKQEGSNVSSLERSNKQEQVTNSEILSTITRIGESQGIQIINLFTNVLNQICDYLNSENRATFWKILPLLSSAFDVVMWGNSEEILRNRLILDL